MTCARGCCPSQREHYRSLAVRTGPEKQKVTVERTDTAEVTTTEHWRDRQDCQINMLQPVKTPRESNG